MIHRIKVAPGFGEALIAVMFSRILVFKPSRSMRTMIRYLLTVFFLLLFPDLWAEPPVEIGSRLELMVDDALIDKLSGGAHLELHHPERREVVLVTDAPWEGNASHYRCVFRDGDIYRMYYGAYQYAEGQTHYGYSQATPHEAFTCYAESRDGIHWTRPELGLIEFKGSTRNNILLAARSMKALSIDPGHVAVFKDPNPACSPEAKYKAVIRSFKVSGVYALKSPDGLHFSPIQDELLLSDGVFDSLNLAFWDTQRGEYRAYFRGWKDKFRGILTATSPDFVEWTKSKWVEFPGAPVEHIYTNQVEPYFRAPHIFVGFPMRYNDRGWVDATDRLPDPEKRRVRAKARERFGSALTDAVFMTSRDGVAFKRWGEAFIRPGPSRSGTWAYGDNSPAWGIVTTKSSLPGAPDELSIYATEGFWTGESLSVRRYSMRIDGFVSLNAPLAGGEMVTRPMVFAGGRLQINYATSAAGGIWVELQDADGKPLEGFSKSDCHEVFGDEIERTVYWQAGDDVSALAGKAVRVRFVLKDADLFSFRFR